MLKSHSSLNTSLISLLLVLIVNLTAHAQSVTDGSTPSGIAPGSPAGSYVLGGFDTINLYNGNLDVRLKVLTVAGRGASGMTVGIGLNPEPWVVKGTGVKHEWWPTIKPGYGPGVMHVRRIGMRYDGPGQACSQDGLTHYRWTRTSITFTASDGTEYEFWDKQSGGPWIDAYPNFCSTGPPRGNEFVTHDGTSATFVSESPIVDRNRYNTNTEQILLPTGYMVLRDGTYYRIANGLVDWIRDRNGNLTTFSYGTNSSDTLTYRKVMTITDSLNRVVSFQYFANYDVITFKGFNGAQRTLTINRSSLSSALRADFQAAGVKKPSELFVGITPEVNETVYNPSVVSSITMPDNRSYQVTYNQYAEVARVVLPTGGAIEYDMMPGSGLVSDESTGQLVYQILRRAEKRRVYVNQTDTTPVELTTYSADIYNVITVDHLDPQNSNQLLAREKHYFYGDPVASLFVQQPATPGPLEGREYKTEYFNVANGTVGTVLRKLETEWEPGLPIVTGAPACNARIKQTTSTLVDTNQASKQVFGYDDTMPFNNQNNVKEYDLGPAGSGSAGPLLRETRTTFVTSASYTANAVHLVSLPLQKSIFDGSGVERARTTLEYDNYILDGSDCDHAFHCLTSRTDVSGFASGFGTGYTTRGNVTKTTNYLLDNGSETGAITGYAQYDVLGNIVKLIDPRSTATNIIATKIYYEDSFGMPNGNARSHIPPSELGGLSSFAYASKTINALGHENYTQRDYYLGFPVDVEDSNGVVSSFSCGTDALDRPKQVIRAANGGTETKSQTTYDYDDLNRVITTSSDQSTYDDKVLKTEVRYDGLGRTTEARQYEDGGNYIAVKTEYDAFGRAYKVSNPFRQSETTTWTTTIFDPLGRAKTVTTHDGAAVKTAYDGNRVLVEDQAHHTRISVSDGLGRLKEVWEITSSDQATEPVSFPGSEYSSIVAGYVTRYEYDTLDNLTSVSQRIGTTGANQVRSFVYDSLKRLTSATNPESGTVSYKYDLNGNVIVKTDARTDPNNSSKKVSTHFEYDALNRIIRRWYNGSSSETDTVNNNPTLPPDVAVTAEANYFYDLTPLPSLSPGVPSFSRGASIGRLVAVTYGTGSSAGDYVGYDEIGRPNIKIQQIGDKNYDLTAQYNLAGAVKSIKYPSDRVVNYQFDAAGRLNNFAGNLGGTSRTYSSEVTYSPFGGMAKEKFGTTSAAIYNKLFYNIRGQLSEVRVSTSYTGPTDDSWNRGAIVNNYSGLCTTTEGAACSGTDNNGNLIKQKLYIPSDDQIPTTNYTLRTQEFSYDSLNRLNWARELMNSGEQWRQEFAYDRWGNRTLSAAGTWLGNSSNPPSILVNETQFDAADLASTNRLYAPGDLALPDAQRQMRYDAAGNLIKDSYTGTGSRTYDAENRMTSAIGTNNQSQTYVYDATGQRVRRNALQVETWQVYGFRGELVAEYPANATKENPSKEYGYRNGQLLVTTSVNGGWGAAPTFTGPNPLTAGSEIKLEHLTDLRSAINQVRAHAGLSPFVFTVDPTPERYVTTVKADHIRQLRTALEQARLQLGLPIGGYAHGTLTENSSLIYAIDFQELRDQVLSAWQTTSSSVEIQWLVTDQLGTPRMVFDESGNLANVKRHDYLPFGEELAVGVGGRTGGTNGQGYGGGDGVRQQFTSKERDSETGLDYFGERYYGSVLGRFTSADPLGGSMRTIDPQTFNRYSYVLNNPLRYIDPNGLKEKDPWDRLSEAEQKAIATKLLVPKGSTTRAVFNKMVTNLDVNQTAANIQSVKNFIAQAGGLTNSATWQQITTIVNVVPQGPAAGNSDWETNRNKLLGNYQSSDIEIRVADSAKFLETLAQDPINKYSVDSRGDEALKAVGASWHPFNNARAQTDYRSDPQLHFANDKSDDPNYGSNYYMVHWDPTSSNGRESTFIGNLRGGMGHGPRAPAGAVTDYLKRTKQTPQ